MPWNSVAACPDLPLRARGRSCTRARTSAQITAAPTRRLGTVVVNHPSLRERTLSAEASVVVEGQFHADVAWLVPEARVETVRVLPATIGCELHESTATSACLLSGPLEHRLADSSPTTI